MTQPIIKKDIEDRVKDIGDVMTGILHFHNTDGFNSIIKKRIINDVEWNVGFGAGGGGSIGLELQNIELNPDTYTSRVDIYSNKITFIDENKNKYEILHTGNISKQPLTIINDQYYEKNRLYGLNMNNSDIINANGIYFKDICDTATEGIHFYAGSSQYNTLWSKDGELLFTPNRVLDDTSGNAYKIITSNGGVINGDLKINDVISTRKETVTSGTTAGTRSALIIHGSTYGNTTSYLKTAGRLSWGDPNPQIIFNSSDSTASGQPLALIYTDSNDIGWGTTLSLVSSESSCGFIAPYVRATSQFQVVRYDDKPAKNTILPIFNIKYQNGVGNYYSTDIISLVGTGNTDNTHNACIMMGSKSGSLHLHAGECGNSMVSTLGLNDTEAIYMTCDGAIYQYVGCANDASSYTLAQTIANNKITAHVPLYGAVWNDYAEFREYNDSAEPPYGRVVIENGDDTLSLSTERLQRGGNICSDTFGFAIGETDQCKMPIAVSGRALVYTYEDRNTYQPGEALCTGPNGTVSRMTREEIKEYPDCIIGYVSAIPTYERWGTGNVEVNGRIWIKVV